MSDVISRQVAISAICSACGKIDCDKMDKCEKLQLPPANCSEFPNSSDTISRAKAIEALKNDMASLDHIIKGMSANDVRLDAYVSQRNQVNYDIYTINNLPPAQPEQLGANLAEVGTDCISRQDAIDALTEYGNGRAVFISVGEAVIRIERLSPAQPERKLQKLAEEIAAVKRSIKSGNSDYLTGYLCALSAVEGMIADMREVTT